jgi:hypothetical protein
MADMTDRDVKGFIHLLKYVGIDYAEALVNEALLPLARSKHISLLDAAWDFADQDDEQDTSTYQLFHALQSIDQKYLDELNLRQPL